MGLLKTVKNLGKTIKSGASKNSHIVMALGAVSGLAVTIYFAYHTKEKIDPILEEQKEKYRRLEEMSNSGESSEEDLKEAKKVITRQTVFKVAKAAAPLATSATATFGLIVGSTVASTAKISTLSGLLSVAETTSAEIWEKTKEVVGEDKAKEIQDAVNQDKVNKTKIPEHPIDANGGNYLCYDAMSGRYFYSDKETIRAAVNTVNDMITSGKCDWVSLNDLYFELGLPPTAGGEDRGFGRYTNINKLELNLSNAIISDTGEPALVMDFLARPTLGYKGY